ncbi:MAG: DUF1127 domain-containing protein [Acidocella sp.]|jgi:uncharacterized protein YjiS (DUF1127 family)|nr:DUF1127 domain-containing protein [Acidocella sp.]
MTTNIYNSFSLGKVGSLLFARQTPMVAAERHPTLLASLKAWRERRAAKAELESLSDRELADIGVTRQEISSVVVRGPR